jgi:hypothetical protein
MRDLRDHLISPPTFATDARERSYELRAAFDELNRRGVDAELVVRCGLARDVEVTLGFSLITKQVVVKHDVGDDLDSFPSPDPMWRALFDHGVYQRSWTRPLI